MPRSMLTLILLLHTRYIASCSRPLEIDNKSDLAEHTDGICFARCLLSLRVDRMYTVPAMRFNTCATISSCGLGNDSRGILYT